VTVAFDMGATRMSLSVSTEDRGCATRDSAPMLANQRMSAVDRAWLLMERPTNPMMIVAVMVLEGRLSRARLRALVTERLLVFERFRQRPVPGALAAEWAAAEPFDLDDHVVTAALPRGAEQAELEALVGELASTPFNSSRPWWTFHLIERYRKGSALIVRIHHCYADGIALVRILLRMADGSDEGTSEKQAVASESAASTQSAVSIGSLYAPVADLLANTLREGADLIEHGLHYALHPAEAAGAARNAVGVIGELARIGTLPDDPPTQLKKPLSGVRHVAWAPPLAFEEVRTIAHTLGCTINDVLISILAGALGRYLESRGKGLSGATLHAAVPVNLRPEAQSESLLGNRFGLVFVALPVGIHHPLERLYAVRASMQALKGSSQALVTLGLLAAVGSLPAAVEDSAIALFTAKASLVASNLPGPREQLHLGGVPISQILFWVPQAGSIGTGVSMLTYNGLVQFGVMSDRQLIPDPHELVNLIAGEFERLVLLVLLGGVALEESSPRQAAPARS
jgi:diacylglycerol O-acyltransferase / wax synthase